MTLVGLAAQQYFSDGNRRDHGRLRLIYQPSLDLGLTLQARYRTYRSSHEDVDRAYFNPKNYSEAMLAVGWRQRFRAGPSRSRRGSAPRRSTASSGSRRGFWT